MTPKWKKSGPNGEKEITFSTGRRFQIEKQYDQNERHKGEWKIMEWDKRLRDWEWHETYNPQWYAKEQVMKMGQYDSKGKKVTESIINIKPELEESPVNMRNLKLINKIKKSGAVKQGSMKKEEAMTAADAGIPHDTNNMGPSRLPAHILRRRLGIPINVTDRRIRKDKSPRMLKKFRRYVDG